MDFLSLAFANSSQQLFPQRGAASVKPTDVILKQDIHRFERAIAIIKHYYIMKNEPFSSKYEPPNPTSSSVINIE